MPKNFALPAKPQAEVFHPERTRLPDLTAARLAYRAKVARRCRLFIRLFTRASFHGLENFPASGPALIVSNHLGSLDLVIALAALPAQPEGIGKVELFDLRVFGRWLDRYGVIWVHRGTPDRRALRAALQALAEGRFLGIAPEGRQSVTGALEEGTGGAAYLALKADVPVIPITLTGTEDPYVMGCWRRLRRPVMTLTVGNPFRLDPVPDFSGAVEAGTERIMRKLAEQLPEQYRGVYGSPAD